MKSTHRPVFLLAVTYAAICAVGCIPEQLSWSSDGRYLAFIDQNESEPGKRNLWVWDSRTGRSRTLFYGETVFCRFHPESNLLMSAIERPQPEDSKRDPAPWDLHFTSIDRNGGSPPTPNIVEPYGVAFTPDGGHLVFIRKNETDSLCELWEYTMKEPKPGEPWERRLFAQSGEFSQPNVDAKGRVLLAFSGGAVGLFDEDSGTTRPLVASSSEQGVLWPVWKDEHSFFCYWPDRDFPEDPAGDLVSLCVASLDDRTTRALASHLVFYQPPSFSADRSKAAVTMIDIPPGAKLSEVEDRASSFQVGIVDVAAASMTKATSEPLGAAWPALDPSGRNVGFLGNDKTVRVLNLDSNKTTMLTTDEESRIYAAAESAQREPQPAQAIDLYDDLLKRFPESRFEDAARFWIAKINLAAPFCDPDAAFNSIMKMNGDFQTEAWALFWDAAHKLASDPAEDWIERFSTEESNKRFGFDTDSPRDLRGLHARLTSRMLYLRVDLSGGHDLAGANFANMVFLLKRDDASGGPFQITPNCDWDLRPERSIVLRRWEGAHARDIEILDENGKIIAMNRTMNLGTRDDDDGPMRWSEIRNGDQEGSIVFAVSRDALDLPQSSRTYSIQAVTLRKPDRPVSDTPGTDRLRTTANQTFERPTDPPSSPGWENALCQGEVADAFGEANSPGEIKKRRVAGGPKVILGAAGIIPVDPVSPCP